LEKEIVPNARLFVMLNLIVKRIKEEENRMYPGAVSPVKNPGSLHPEKLRNLNLPAKIFIGNRS
jgi:hypothetical protein